MSKPEKNKTGRPRDVPEDVREKQDAEYSEGDFENALDRATERVESPSERDPGSSKR